MEISFSKDQTPVIDVPSTTTPAPETPSGAVAVVSAPKPIREDASGFLVGDHLPGFDEIILPRLNLVQGVGQLKDSFPQGAIVYGQNLAVFILPIIEKSTGNAKVPGSAPLNVTVIGFRPTRFVEKVAGGERGIICNTEDEVRAAGGTLDYNEFKLKEAAGMKRFDTLAEAFCLVKRPAHVADDNTVFVYDIAGEKYGLALWAMKGSSFTVAKATFFTARKMGCLREGGYPSWSYNVSTRSKAYAGNTFFVPVCLPHAPTSPEVRQFIKDLLNPPQAEQIAAPAAE